MPPVAKSLPVAYSLLSVITNNFFLHWSSERIRCSRPIQQLYIFAINLCSVVTRLWVWSSLMLNGPFPQLRMCTVDSVVWGYRVGGRVQLVDLLWPICILLLLSFFPFLFFCVCVCFVISVPWCGELVPGRKEGRKEGKLQRLLTSLRRVCPPPPRRGDTVTLPGEVSYYCLRFAFTPGTWLWWRYGTR